MTQLTVTPTAKTLQGVDQAQADLAAEAKAIGLALAHKGTDESLSVFNFSEVIWALAPVTILTYQVPVGQVAKVNRVAVFIDNPAAWALNTGIGWRILVNGLMLSNLFACQPAGSAGYWPLPVGDLMTPLEIEPIWLQATETITIELGPAAGYDDILAYGAYIGGRLYKPATGVTRIE